VTESIKLKEWTSCRWVKGDDLIHTTPSLPPEFGGHNESGKRLLSVTENLCDL
jgi:hypothetical protein